MSDPHTDAIDAVFGARKACMDAVRQIERIAKALGVLGLIDAANTLYDATTEIDVATEKAAGAFAASVSQRCVDTERATGNMIAAFIAGSGAKSNV